MRIYLPQNSEGFELCHPRRDEDFHTISLAVDGTPHTAAWRPLPMKLVREIDGRALLTSDSPWLASYALIFRLAAVSKLGGILEQHGELLPLTCDDASVVLYNPTRVLNALDEQRSKVTRFKDGRLMRVQRYVFDPLAIEGSEIFKLKHLRVSPTFVSERVVELWRSSGLRGLDFVELWRG